MARARLIVGAALALVVVTCGSDDTGRSPTAEGELAVAAPTPGSATLTIGDHSWEFDGFRCAMGAVETRSDVYSFSSDGRGEHGGNRTQMQANVRDASGQDLLEGPDVIYELYITDIDDFDDPVISFEMVEGTVSVIDSVVSGSGTFDDMTTPTEFESIQGTLEGDCG